MVWALVGKEFPDMRQSEREIKFISVETLLEQRPAQERTVFEQRPLVQFYTQSTGSRIGVLRVIADWMRGGAESKAKTLSLWARRGDRLYCSGAPEIR